MQSFSIKGPDARPAELPFGRTVNSFLKNVYLRTGKAFDPASEIKTLTDQDGRPVFLNRKPHNWTTL